MRATIDAAGRVVIPKSLRTELGLVPGEVEIVRDGAGVRVTPVAGRGLERRAGRLVIPEGPRLTDEHVRDLRRADQR